MAEAERAASSIIRRERLLAQLAAAQPRIIALIAPAGFGKSSMARQYCQSQPAWAVCDLAGVDDEAELARRLTSALEREDPARGAELSHLQLSITEGGPSDTDKMNLLLQAWARPCAPAAFVFENAERVDAASAVQEFLWRLLAARPESRVVVICSRTPLRARLSRFADPHHIVTLRAPQLSFDRAELVEAFGGVAITPLELERVMEISRGWPIAILLFVRFAREGTLHELLGHLDDVAFENLHDYLAEQVLGSWSREALDVLAACACIPLATPDDVAFALGTADARSTLDEFVRNSPFVVRTPAGAYEVHPLLASALLEANTDRRHSLLATAAKRWMEKANLLRAARLYLECDDAASAAEALNQVDTFMTQIWPPEYTSVLASIPTEIVARYPRLWYATVHMRRYRIDNRLILRETQALWRETAAFPPMQRTMVAVFLALLGSDFGDHEGALRMLRAFTDELGTNDPSSPAVASVTHIHAAVLARTGRLEEAARIFDRAWPVASQRNVSAAIASLNRSSTIERMLGRRQEERELLELALEHAHKSGFATMVSRTMAEIAFGAWFAGERELFEESATRLEERVAADAIRGLSHFASCAARREDAAPVGIEEPMWLARAHLVAWSYEPDDERAGEHARAATRAADAYKDPALQVITRVAHALVAPRQRAALFDEAREQAKLVDSDALRHAVEAASRRAPDAGILGPLVAMRASQASAVAAPLLEIDFLTISVRRLGQPVALGERERDALFAIALSRRAAPPEQLAASLWPAMEPQAALDALDYSLIRLRTAIGADAVPLTPEGHRLCDGAQVDLWEIEDAAADVRGTDKLGDAERERLRALHDRFRLSEDTKTPRSPVFEKAERRIREYRREIAERLGRDALARRAGREALAYAREMATYDRWDEAARELAIQALLAAGDKAGALKEFEEYRQVLKTELHAEPSGRLVDQVKGAVGALLHPDTLFDVGADALNLVVPGGGIALRVVKAIAAKRKEH
ncbi:MAG TPA: BTAD domain-containing putative transcriptional regulator [Candidatus Eremiobacteraceae bacterium]|nr:BTAD domain-containing putative transcriptional regulator [Candidatus Eremiobacteraceae bacterium]